MAVVRGSVPNSGKPAVYVGCRTPLDPAARQRGLSRDRLRPVCHTQASAGLSYSFSIYAPALKQMWCAAAGPLRASLVPQSRLVRAAQRLSTLRAVAPRSGLTASEARHNTSSR
jgi:hypothetical protein